MKRIFSISRLFVVIGFLVSVATAETLKVGVVQNNIKVPFLQLQ